MPVLEIVLLLLAVVLGATFSYFFTPLLIRGILGFVRGAGKKEEAAKEDRDL